MSDVQMTADPSPQAAPPPVADEVVSPPEPLKSHTDPKPTEAKAEPAKQPEKPSTRESLQRAREKVEAAEKADPAKDVKTDPKVQPAKAEPAKVETKPVPRTDQGKFAPREATGEDQQRPAAAGKPADPNDHHVSPKRFSREAQETWDKLGPEHDHLKQETHRAFREMEAGIQKYRAPADRYEKAFKEFDELALKSNVDPKAVAAEYVRLDRMINNPKTLVRGIEEILNGRGITLQQFAQHISGKAGDPSAPANPGKSAGEIALAQELATLRKRLDSNDQRAQQDKTAQVTQGVAAWSKDKPHFDRLAPRIASLIRDGNLSLPDAYAKALVEAQDFAREISGDSGLKRPSTAPAVSAQELEVQTRKGSRSITGAPGSGSAPAAKQPSSSIRDAIKRAASQAL